MSGDHLSSPDEQPQRLSRGAKFLLAFSEGGLLASAMAGVIVPAEALWSMQALRHPPTHVQGESDVIATQLPYFEGQTNPLEPMPPGFVSGSWWHHHRLDGQDLRLLADTSVQFTPEDII